MAIGPGVRRAQAADEPGRPLSPRSWTLWLLPRTALLYILTVEAAALILVSATTHLVAPQDHHLMWFLVLLLASAVDTEVSRGIELTRGRNKQASRPNLKSIWIFAAILLLPPPMTAAVICLAYAHPLVRLGDITDAHRVVFSASTMILSGGGAAMVITAISGTYPGVPDGPRGLIALVVGGVVYWLVNYALVIGAIVLTAPPRPWRRALGSLGDQIVVAAAIGLGIAIAVMLVHQPWTTAVLMPTVFALHRGLLLSRFQTAAHTDAKTGLSNAASWHQLASKEFARARRTNGTLGLLMIDLDHFKKVNDRFGHLAGDEVLRAVAEALEAEVREQDQVGRFGGEEFVIALPHLSASELATVAERVRQCIARLTVTVATTGGRGYAQVEGLTASVGAALYPMAGDTLDGVLLAADNAVYVAKRNGRDQVRMVGLPGISGLS